ncbi:MAG: hypothetical protein H0U73_05345 [Tatlockia sp.]|nr:hypothetical protein [Tatlockia sp.]
MRANKFYLWTVIFYVLLIYVFYPDFKLTVSSYPSDLYQYLTESFLSGKFHLNVQPKAELINLPDPYDPIQNLQFRLHDASLFKGKYYLYFGPLPVIFFYLPFKLLTGFYPSDGFALFFFLSLTFLVSLFLLIKIKEKYFPSLAHWQTLLAGFLLGLGTGVVFLFSRQAVYEVAIASALCFMFFSFYFIYRIVNFECQTKDVFLFSLCLALTVAGRPHFALICVFLLPAMFIYLLTKVSKNRRLILLVALLIPSFSVAFILGGYNYLRFGSVFDFGHFWQLSCNDIRALHDELLDWSKIPRNFLYSFYFYVLQPFSLSLKFPFLGLRLHHCRYFIDNDYFLEAVAGVLTTTPVILFILALPKMLTLYFKEKKDKKSLAWFVVFVSFVPTISLLFLLTLPFAIQRYELDFLPYLVFLAIISFWMLTDYFFASPRFNFVKIFFISTALISILTGLCLGFAYWAFI